MPFSESIRTRVLLWSDRHCCLCKKPCGTNIEVAHIVPEAEGGGDDLDNAIPLCFECHSKIGHYNPNHPKGTKIKADEIKKHREQIYDEFTQHLVPPISYRLTQSGRKLPDVGFEIAHCSNSLPVRARVKVEGLSSNNTPLFKIKAGYYSGKKEWNLRPSHKIRGHFALPPKYAGNSPDIVCRIDVIIIDQYEREHEQLPVHYRYSHERDDWVLEP
jgi:hypothetical protein